MQNKEWFEWCDLSYIAKSTKSCSLITGKQCAGNMYQQCIAYFSYQETSGQKTLIWLSLPEPGKRERYIIKILFKLFSNYNIIQSAYYNIT